MCVGHSHLFLIAEYHRYVTSVPDYEFVISLLNVSFRYAIFFASKLVVATWESYEGFWDRFPSEPRFKPEFEVNRVGIRFRFHACRSIYNIDVVFCFGNIVHKCKNMTKCACITYNIVNNISTS